jgi:hypothetical protein
VRLPSFAALEDRLQAFKDGARRYISGAAIAERSKAADE